MKTTYKIEQFDNGWSIDDKEQGCACVVEEKLNDTRHERFRRKLGGWLYEDIDAFFDEITDVRCIVEIKLKRVEDGKVCDD